MKAGIRVSVVRQIVDDGICFCGNKENAYREQSKSIDYSRSRNISRAAKKFILCYMVTSFD